MDIETEAERLAREQFPGLDWSMPENLGATAVQRAYFRRGFKAAWQAATLAEREACAKHIDVPYQRTGHEFAKAIRARGE